MYCLSNIGILITYGVHVDAANQLDIAFTLKSRLLLILLALIFLLFCPTFCNIILQFT